MITLRPSEESHKGFFRRYVNLVPDGDLVGIYEHQRETLSSLIASVPEEVSQYRYEEGKWNIKEVMGHISDAERMFSYWMFCGARKESNTIGPIHIGDYVTRGRFNQPSMSAILDEWKSVRGAPTSLLRTLDPEVLQYTSLFRDHPTTVLAMACIIPGHVEHHINILHERYGLS